MGSIGRYRVVKKLATGGMAEVYLAKVAGPGGFEKHVVVKQILPQLADSELYVKMFLEEARLAAQLDHPNIVHVFDFGEVDGSYFLAMEYVEGANLRHVLRWAFKTGHSLPPALAARIVSFACEGLAYAHQFTAPGSDQVTKLVHRDVSPENIMLSHTGAVKLLDFGVAKVSSEDNRSKVGSLKGKIAYMPPEQLKGGSIDRRVDIYALGIVLYQALSGKRPYGQATDVALIQAILNEEPVPLLKHRLDLPDNLLDIVSKAMAKKPENRFQTCEEMRDALEAYIAHEGVPANAAQIGKLVAAYQAGTAEAKASGKAGGADSAPGTRGGPGAQLDGPPFATPADASDGALEGVAPKATGDAKGPWPSGWKFGKSPVGPVPGAPAVPPHAASPPAPRASKAPAARAPAKTTPGGPSASAPRGGAAMPLITAATGTAPTPAAQIAAPTQRSADPLNERVPTPAGALAPAPPQARAARPSQPSAAAAPPTPLITATVPTAVARPSAPAVSGGSAQVALGGERALPLISAQTAVPPSGSEPVLGTLLPPSAAADAASAPRAASAAPGRAFDWTAGQGAPPSPAAAVSPPAPPPPPRTSSVGTTTGTLEAVRAGDAQATRAWAALPLVGEAVRQAFRDAVRTDRSSTLLRKLPAVISRLTDMSPSIPWSMAEAFAGALDAALLSDDHPAVVRVLDRAASRPGAEARFASLASSELCSPLRMAWLVERLRTGLPADVAGLQGWLVRIGPQSGALLLNCLEMSEPGPAQELFAEALATSIPTDPGPVRAHLREPNLRDVAALSFALERSGAPERAKVFNRLIGRREVPLQVEILTGRARARGGDALLLLEGALGDKSEEIRLRAIRLIGELCGTKGYLLLLKSLKEAAFEARPLPERAQFWTAAFECGGEAVVAEVEQVLSAKASLLNKKKVVDAKLALIEGLGRAKSEVARATLERIAGDDAQSDEVQSAAVAALDGARRSTGEQSVEHKAIGEWRVHLMARISLDFVMLARATTTVDLASGLLDSGIERFRDGVRQLVSQDGKMQLVVTAAGPTINGTPVSFGPLHEAVAPAVVNALQVRDLQGFAVEASLPAAEFKGLLLRAFDPDGGRERLPHIKVINFAGQPLASVGDPAPAADPTARARELFAQVVRWLSTQRDHVRAGRPLELTSGDAALEELVRLFDGGQTRFLGVMRWQPSETGTLVHAVNTALLAMAFAHDLGLGRTALREALEVSLMLGLAEAVGNPSMRPGPEEPTGEEERFYAAGLVLTNRVNRLGTATAVGTVEAGMPHSARGGPGLIASVHALANTFDALTAGAGGASSPALEAINGRLRPRFHADLVGLFTQWVFAQGSAPAS